MTAHEPGGRDELSGYRVAAFIPNDDTIVSALKRFIVVDHEYVVREWRVDGDWTALTSEEARTLERSSIPHVIDDPFALETVLRLYDLGAEICACIVEAALQPSDEPRVYRRLGYTQEHVPELLRRRRRREESPSELTSWLTRLVQGEGQDPTSGELLTRMIALHEEALLEGRPLTHLRELPSHVDLTVDWNQFADDDAHTRLGWERLLQFTAALITLTSDVVVISVDTEQFDSPVYVQACREDAGALHIEAVSDKFLDPPLSPDALDALHTLGWEDPPGDGLPNHVQFLERGRTAPVDVAELLIATLRRVYSVTLNDGFAFAPRPLVRSILAGDFGPDLALNPNLSPQRAAKVKRSLTLWFPDHVGGESSAGGVHE